MRDLKALAKQCLGIVSTATLKDKEIEMLIDSAKSDLNRVGVDVENNIEDSLVENTIMLYVKAHYGDTEINKRNEYLKRYKENMRNLKYSCEYLKEEDSNA